MGNNQNNQIIKKGAKEIDLKEIFLIIRRRIWAVVILTLLMAGLGVWYSKHHEPVPLYQSSTRLLIDTKSANGNTTDMSTLMVMFTDPTVLTKLSQQIGLSRSPGALSNEISVSNLNDSQIISLQVTDRNAYLAAEIANKEVEILKQEVATVLNFSNIRQLSEANINPSPINQGSSHKYEVYGTLGGLILGVFWCFFRNSLDDTIRSEKELEKLLDLPVVGSIPIMTNKNSRKYKSKRFEFLFKLWPIRKKDSSSQNTGEESVSDNKRLINH